MRRLRVASVKIVVKSGSLLSPADFSGKQHRLLCAMMSPL
jgi:hypothetical protein